MCISLINWEHLFRCLLTFYLYIFLKCLFSPLSTFYTVGFCCWAVGALHIFLLLISYQLVNLQASSQILNCFFTLCILMHISFPFWCSPTGLSFALLICSLGVSPNLEMVEGKWGKRHFLFCSFEKWGRKKATLLHGEVPGRLNKEIGSVTTGRQFGLGSQPKSREKELRILYYQTLR